MRRKSKINAVIIAFIFFYNNDLVMMIYFVIISGLGKLLLESNLLSLLVTH